MDEFLARPEPWMADALCAQVDGDLWFPERGGSAAEAKRICRSCPVRAQCLELALEQRETGIWGGTSEHERRRMSRDEAA